MALKLRNPKKPTPAPAPPPPPVVEDRDATPAEVVQELRDELAQLRDHTGNHAVEALVDKFDRFLEAFQELMVHDDSDDSDD
jgi:hypothetical protein